MRKTTLLLLAATAVFSTSCVSEYEERLEQGIEIKERISIMKEGMMISLDDQLVDEISTLENELFLLAKVSGNEELFLNQIFKD